MLPKTLIFLLAVVLTASCKKDPKKDPAILPHTVIHKKKSIQKSYHFFSTTKELELLYQSDAWHMVLKDAKKIGLQWAQVAKLDSIYFIRYSLIGTKPTIFDQKMDALPAFKNFREMSQTLTGVPLNYHQELAPILSVCKDTVTTVPQHEIILHTSTSATHKKLFTQIALQKAVATRFENLLKNRGVSSFEIYQQNQHLYAVITSSKYTVLEQLYDKLYWNSIFDKEALASIQQTYPKFDSSNAVFKNWIKMNILP